MGQRKARDQRLLKRVFRSCRLEWILDTTSTHPTFSHFLCMDMFIKLLSFVLSFVLFFVLSFVIPIQCGHERWSGLKKVPKGLLFSRAGLILSQMETTLLSNRVNVTRVCREEVLRLSQDFEKDREWAVRSKSFESESSRSESSLNPISTQWWTRGQGSILDSCLTSSETMVPTITVWKWKDPSTVSSNSTGISPWTILSLFPLHAMGVTGSTPLPETTVTSTSIHLLKDSASHPPALVMKCNSFYPMSSHHSLLPSRSKCILNVITTHRWTFHRVKSSRCKLKK